MMVGRFLIYFRVRDEPIETEYSVDGYVFRDQMRFISFISFLN